MRRREFVGLVGGATVAWPLGTLAQQGAKTPRIGILAPGHAEGPDASLPAWLSFGIPVHTVIAHRTTGVM